MNSGPVYEIRVRGHLNQEWATWLNNATIENLANGEAVLTVPISDQAALNGLINRVFALNLYLVSVNPVPPAANE
jgi:hypothetical protein